MKKKKEPTDYPRTAQFGIKIQWEPMSHVKWADIKKALSEKQQKRFNSFFGIQTCYIDGPYPWDVEAVLERMCSKRLTGTQLDWD